jgi:hypothetical protein
MPADLSYMISCSKVGHGNLADTRKISFPVLSDAA